MTSSHEKRGTNILIVEDSRTQAEQLRTLLIQNGYVVSIAINGNDALQILESFLPDLIITDIVMPEMDGYTLCKHVKQDSRLRKIPVILVTALSDPVDILEGLESGANNFIIKPYDEKYLLSRIEIVLVNSHYEENEAIQVGFDIMFAGKKHHITSSSLQILNILLSTYEIAIQKNEELEEAKTQLRMSNEYLEETVTRRTSELENINQSLTREIEIRKTTELAFQRKSRAYQMISECNQFLVRATNVEEILQGICSILLKTGGYGGVWVGSVQSQDPMNISVIAQSGFTGDYHQKLQKYVSEISDQSDPIRTIVQTRKPVIGVDPSQWIGRSSWVKDVIECGYTNISLFPILIQDNVIGLITIYTRDLEIFDCDEISLLSELMGDLSYGIQSIRDRDERKRMESEVKRSEIQYRRLFETSKDGIILIEEESGKIIDANPSVLKILNSEHSSLLGKEIFELGIFPDKQSAEQMFVHLKQEKYARLSDISLSLPDGKNCFVELVCNIYSIDEKNVIQCNIRNITERKKLEDEIRSLNRDLEFRVEKRTNELRDINEKLQETNEELTATEEELRVQVEVTNDAYLALENSEKKFRRLYESDLIGIFFSDTNTIWDANDAFLKMIGYSREDLKQGIISWQKITPPEWKNSDIKGIDELLVRGSCPPFEKEYIHKDGSRVAILNGAALLETDPVSWISFTLDVTERKKMTVLIEESLAEKEILLKEIHHRVKNNMQVISSLLFLQSQMAKDESVRMLFKESQNRIRSISLVHEQLYQSHNLSTIEYGTYLKKMFIPLFESFKVDVRKVTMNIEVPTVMISIDKAVPCSLIVNELLSNSLKHAFPEGKSGKIVINFTFNPDSGMYLLDYRDNGIGFPQDMDIKKTGTLGMSLLFGLTRQLSGTISRVEGEGVHFMISFPSNTIKNGE